MRRTAGLILIGALLASPFVPKAGWEGSSAASPPARLVLSSLAPGQRVLTLGTASLYPKNDPWEAYLADETTCPGGERTDFPEAREVDVVACLVNFARLHRGLRPLSIVPALNEASVRKAEAIIRCGNFAHNPCGGDWTSSVRSAGYLGTIGENLYLASGRWAAPRVAVDAWLNSRPHRKTMFRRAWRGQGFALSSGERVGIYRDVKVWVSVLGDG